MKNETKTVVVPNISCGHCVHTIQEELSEVVGVVTVKADQATKHVEVSWGDPATWEAIQAKLVEINYPPAQPNVTIN
ncbi:MAG TPA: heavy-metal-associated domain-containing protein [Aggregatilineales bacterium]|nr:heavy-metal-associated domain-containing protein [Anaerolineales bacterium]HRE49318.1 heavy-metal-associated domain-containing protein [Aggregatilineales bacterium]